MKHLVLRLSIFNDMNPIIEQSKFRNQLNSILVWLDANIPCFFSLSHPLLNNKCPGHPFDIVFTNYLHGQCPNQTHPLTVGDNQTENAQDTRKEVLMRGLFGFILVKRKKYIIRKSTECCTTHLIKMLPRADKQNTCRCMKDIL